MENKEDEKVVYCAHCGCAGNEEDFEIVNDEFFCESCYDESVVCENCGLLLFLDDDEFVCVDDSFFCDENCANESGYRKCHDCGRYEKKSYMYYYERYGDYICSSCYEDSFFICDNCGEVCEDDEMCVKNKGDLCHSELIEGINKILKKYNLETLFVYERDGSINCGFEIISQPMSFNFFVEHSEVFKKVLRYLDENGAKSHDTSTCGLHVHFTKKFFNSDEISRLLYLFEKFKNDLVKFSRRSTDNLNRWASFLNISQENLSLDYLKTRGEDVSRYRAVNLTNSKTIEVRIFKGTLLFDSFASSIELVKIISELAKTLSDSEIIKIERFEDIIENSIYLKKYCKERKIIEGGV